MIQSRLGKLIKDLRESSGLSQKDLAKDICSQSEIGIEYCLETETSYLLGELFYQQGLTHMNMET